MSHNLVGIFGGDSDEDETSFAKETLIKKQKKNQEPRKPN